MVGTAKGEKQGAVLAVGRSLTTRSGRCKTPGCYQKTEKEKGLRTIVKREKVRVKKRERQTAKSIGEKRI